MTHARLWIGLGACYALLGVVLGAFGAHALRDRLSPAMLQIWHTAVEYQFYHALALLLLGLLVLLRPAAGQTLSGGAFAVGIVLFCGSLYALCLTGVRVLGIITPFGGALFLVGWAAMLWSVWRG